MKEATSLRRRAFSRCSFIVQSSHNIRGRCAPLWESRATAPSWLRTITSSSCLLNKWKAFKSAAHMPAFGGAATLSISAFAFPFQAFPRHGSNAPYYPSRLSWRPKDGRRVTGLPTALKNDTIESVETTAQSPFLSHSCIYSSSDVDARPTILIFADSQRKCFEHTRALATMVPCIGVYLEPKTRVGELGSRGSC
jgi:hypothetical protein